MQEVKVLTTALPAEYGHSGGGIMNISYKGGTNDFHGLAEERYVSKKMIHRAWSDPAVPTGPFSFHLMSANISGPIKRNKTFFLFGWQRHHERSGNNRMSMCPVRPCWPETSAFLNRRRRPTLSTTRIRWCSCRTDRIRAHRSRTIGFRRTALIRSL